MRKKNLPALRVEERRDIALTGAGGGTRTREYLLGGQVPYRLATPAFGMPYIIHGIPIGRKHFFRNFSLHIFSILRSDSDIACLSLIPVWILRLPVPAVSAHVVDVPRRLPAQLPARLLAARVVLGNVAWTSRVDDIWQVAPARTGERLDDLEDARPLARAEIEDFDPVLPVHPAECGDVSAREIARISMSLIDHRQ